MTRYFSYVGEKSSVTQRGVTFERNVPTPIDDEAHAAKLAGNSHWKEVAAPEVKVDKPATQETKSAKANS